MKSILITFFALTSLASYCLAIKPYLVAYYQNPSGRRQLSEFSTPRDKATLESFITNDLSGTTDGDWYRLPAEGAINAIIERTWNLGGGVYDLPYR
ncbi:hypothetical protein BYT27DRAFT_7185265 [Phlegmacium glaucopus]|nr:hypothetical protein BYT27DRAFT_7185265 [Phlegmacium glaucopus]